MNLRMKLKILLLFVCCNLFSQKIIISDEFTWYDGTLKGVINYSSIMFGEKVFVGVESGTWKDIDGIVAAESTINENLSIYSFGFFIQFFNGCLSNSLLTSLIRFSSGVSCFNQDESHSIEFQNL